MTDSERGTAWAEAPERSPDEHRDSVTPSGSDPAGSRTVTLDFERGDFEGWSVRRLAGPHSAVIQSQVVRSGTRACRFEVRPGDVVSQGLRAELRDWYNAPFEADTWYGFSTFLPADFAPPAGVGVVLAQWHDQAEPGDPAGKPPLAVRYLDGTLRITGASAAVASDFPDTVHLFAEVERFRLGAWHDFVFRVRWSRASDSAVEAWLDGAPLASFRGPLGYRNQIRGPYFKLGVYASGRIDGPLVVYHDNYRRDGGHAEVDPARLHENAGRR